MIIIFNEQIPTVSLSNLPDASDKAGRKIIRPINKFPGINPI